MFHPDMPKVPTPYELHLEHRIAHLTDLLTRAQGTVSNLAAEKSRRGMKAKALNREIREALRTSVPSGILSPASSGGRRERGAEDRVS